MTSRMTSPDPAMWAEPPMQLLRQFTAIALFAGLANASLLCGPAIASQLAVELRFDAEQVGMFFSMEFMGCIVAGIAGRWLLPAFDWRKLALTALSGVVLGNLLTLPVLGNFPVLMAVRLGTATCGSLLSIAALASANENPQASRAISLHILGQLAMGVVGLALLPMLFSRWGVAAYFVSMILVLLACAPMAVWLAPKARHKPMMVAKAEVSPAIGLLRYPLFLLFYIALGGIWTFAGQVAKTVGINAIAAGHILSIATFAGVLGSLLASLLRADIDFRPPIAIGYALLVGGAALLLEPNSAAVFTIGMIAIKFAWSFAIPYAAALAGRLDHHGRIMAELTVLVGIGLTTGPMLAGFLIERSGGFFWMLALEVALLFGSGVCACLMAFAMEGKGEAGQPKSETD